MEAFIYCCGRAHELRQGEKKLCPVCGKELKFPRKVVAAIGTCEQDREERFLNDTHPLP